MTNRILIGALSAAAYGNRRQDCLATWIPIAAKLGMTTRFLLGNDTPSVPMVEDERLYLPVPDSYPCLPQKTRAWCQWALDRTGWDYLFKCDDDTAVSATRLASYALEGRDYIGAEWRPGVDYGSGGAGYLLSRRAAEVVAENLTFSDGPEDLLVGEVLKTAGIRLSIEPRFVPWGNMDHRPRPDNELITAHAVGRGVFEAIRLEVDVPALEEWGNDG